MGHVFLGRDLGLDRLVALKFIADGSPSAGARERFLIEARAIARLSHPNVVAVYRVGEVDGRPYIAYELVPGLPLSEHPLPMPWPTALRHAIGIARGLEAAHSQGILHRDIKPANVMVSARGDVKLIDFGLAKVGSEPEPAAAGAPPLPAGAEFWQTPQPGAQALTATGALLGTPAYLAPEQWLGRGASPRSDLFSAGLLLYMLLVGQLPHAGLDAEGIARYVTTQDAPSVRAARPEVPESLADLVRRCLRRDPMERPTTAREVRLALEDLERVFLPQASGPFSRPERARLLASLSRLRLRQDPFITAVYERLFGESPSLRPLFPADLLGQGRKVLHALQLAIDGLEEPERFAPMLKELGLRHVHYGVQAEHFAPLGRALLGAILAFDDDPEREELTAAWLAAFGFIESTMRQGLVEGGETLASGQVMPVQTPGPQTPAATPGQAQQPPPTPAAPADSWPGPEPEVRYAFHGDLSLAYQVYGDGPLEIILFGWLSHVELAWRQRDFATFLRRLGRLGRVVIFDKRGSGMSDRTSIDCTFEERLGDLAAVQAAAGFQRPVLFGLGEGGAQAAVYAALFPERVRGLVLFGAAARLRQDADPAVGLTYDLAEQYEKEVRLSWGKPDSLTLRRSVPSRQEDREFMEWFAFYVRMVVSPGAAVSLLRSLSRLDVLRLVPLARTPALVLHRRDDQLVPVALGRALAQALPTARFVELPGEDNLPCIGDQEALFRELQDFLSTLEEPPAAAPLRVITVLVPGGADDAVEELAARAAMRAALSPDDGAGRLPDGALLLVHRRCRDAQRAAEELRLIARSLGVTLRTAITAGSYEGPEGDSVAAARALADAAAADAILTDEAAASLLSG